MLDKFISRYWFITFGDTMRGVYVRSEETKKRISETRKRLVAEGKLKVWNKGLTKRDPRVKKYVDGGKATQFKPGPRLETRGEGNAYWKGGRTIQNGAKGIKYIMCRVPDHPYAVRGYVMEHRLLVEKKFGRYLQPHEIVHHKNGNNLDNRLSNLQVMTQADHIKWHVYKIKPNLIRK